MEHKRLPPDLPLESRSRLKCYRTRGGAGGFKQCGGEEKNESAALVVRVIRPVLSPAS